MRIRKHRTPTYYSWDCMKRRCLDPKHDNFKNYGGRGIRICPWWMEFKNFLADMGERPKGKTLDRLDKNGNYEPDNCRWATSKEQNSNRRDSNKIIKYNTLSLTLTQWAKRLSVKEGTLKHRIRSGWPIQKTLATL